MSFHIQFGDRRFAVKEHESSFHHYDLRIHLDGKTLLSFVLYVPLHLDPARPLRAVRVGDHNLDYLLSERIIPPDMPGAGPTAVWDDGYFRVVGKESMILQLSRGELRIKMMGRRLQGNYILRWVGPEEKDWLLVKEPDSFADPSRRFPDVLTPEKIESLKRKKRPHEDNDSLELFG